MAVVSVKERFWGRVGDTTPQWNGVHVEKKLRRLLVTTNDKTDTAETVRNGANVPQVGDQYAGGNEAYWVQAVRPVQHFEHPLLWEVDVEYSNFPFPLVEIFYTTERTEEEITAAFSDSAVQIRDLAITTSAGERFDPQPVLPKGRTQIHVICRQPHNEQMQRRAENRVWTINHSDFTINNRIYYPQELLLVDWSAKPIFGVYPYYWEWQFQFSHDPEKWVHRPLDRGYEYYLDEEAKAAGKRTAFMDTGGNASGLGLLDGDGMALDMTTDPPPDPEFLEYYIYREEDFNELPLPVAELHM